MFNALTIIERLRVENIAELLATVVGVRLPSAQYHYTILGLFLLHRIINKIF